MVATPPCAVPMVVAHDRAGVDAALAFVRNSGVRNNGRPVVVLLSFALAAAGPKIARAMVATDVPDGAIVVLDCGPDPGVAVSALTCGWTRLQFTGQRAAVHDMARAWDATIWTADELQGGDRQRVDLTPGTDFDRALATLHP